jgi:uncharacterized protein YeaO (DUF488 family)
MKQLRIKRVYEAPARDDGVRVLVDRLWPRGLSKEKADVEIWAKDVAPSTELRKWFGHVPARWADFQQRYTAELEANDVAVVVYGARDTEHNGAIVLRDYILAHHRRRLAR